VVKNHGEMGGAKKDKKSLGEGLMFNLTRRGGKARKETVKIKSTGLREEESKTWGERKSEELS